MSIRRAAIDDHLPTPGDDEPDVSGKVRGLMVLKSVAISLDQIVNRSLDDFNRWGAVDPATAKVNDLDFAEVRKQLRILEVGLETGRAMLATVEAQLGVTPPQAEPKNAPRRRAGS